MNSSNSFNICPRCGNANALNAKYCSRCGGQLKVPEEPVVCHKCHTRNTPMANFCRNCGAELKMGMETKICPKCGKEVDINDNVCVCGYSFVTLQQTLPAVNAVRVDETNTQNGTQKSKTVYKTKGGRGWAIAAIGFILLFAYYVIAPYILPVGEGVVFRPEFLVNLDMGFGSMDGTAATTIYGYDCIAFVVDAITSVIGGAPIGQVFSGAGIGVLMIVALTVVFVITAFVHLIVAFVRCFTTKRSKKMNWYFLIMAILSTLIVGFITLFYFIKPEGFMATVASWFALTEDTVLGYAVWSIPLYFWFFFLYSLCAKAKKLKEHAA